MIEPAVLRNLVDRAERCLARDDGRLWGRIAARWILCTPEHWYFSEPVAKGELVSGLWRLDAPDKLVANTAVEHDGRWWAQVSTPGDPDQDTDILLLHEVWHATVQRERGWEAALPDADTQLETVEGRALFYTEVAAWTQAVENPVFLGDAIALRHHRRSKTSPLEWQRQLLLDVTEGLAEYSGVTWAGAGTDYLRTKVSASREHSLVRAGGYLTGPAMGLALDTAIPNWRSHVQLGVDLGDLAGAAPTDLASALARHGYEEILSDLAAGEAAQAVDRERRREAFCGPLLRFSIHGITFDPRRVEASPLGTCYVEAATSSAEFHLQAHDGLVVTSDFQHAYVPCPKCPEPDSRRLSGPGWNAELTTGWEQVAVWLPGPSEF